MRSSTAPTSKRWFSVIGRLALIVSLWHAPLPMVHAHGADFDDPASADAFVDHLVEYHPDVAMNSHVDFGWHWHLVPPPANCPGDESTDGHCPFCPQHTQDNQLQASQATDALVVVHWFAVEWLPSVPMKPAAVSTSTATQFLDTYLGSVSLGTLLRIARC